jgi:hypothetical protein
MPAYAWPPGTGIGFLYQISSESRFATAQFVQEVRNLRRSNPATLAESVRIDQHARRKAAPMRHRKLEERSLALHREIARRIKDNPGLLTRVRGRLFEDIRSGRFSISLTDAMQEWLDLLNTSSLEQILELLVDQGENARRLRQSTPFAGILTQEERRRILEFEHIIKA